MSDVSANAMLDQNDTTHFNLSGKDSQIPITILPSDHLLQAL